jgi:hypothetical protein
MPRKKPLKPDYRKMRAAYVKSWYPVSRIGMGKARRTGLPRFNGTNGGYGTMS